MTEKQQMMSEPVGNWWRRFEWCILNAKIGWSSNKFKKHWSARVTDEFSSETLILTPKKIDQFVHEVRPVFAVTLYTLLHMLCGWNDDTMPSSNIFRVHFVVIFNFTVIELPKHIGKCIKSSKLCHKGLKVDDMVLNGACWTEKASGVVRSY